MQLIIGAEVTTVNNKLSNMESIDTLIGTESFKRDCEKHEVVVSKKDEINDVNGVSHLEMAHKGSDLIKENGDDSEPETVQTDLLQGEKENECFVFAQDIFEHQSNDNVDNLTNLSEGREIEANIESINAHIDEAPKETNKGISTRNEKTSLMQSEKLGGLEQENDMSKGNRFSTNSQRESKELDAQAPLETLIDDKIELDGKQSENLLGMEVSGEISKLINNKKDEPNNIEEGKHLDPLSQSMVENDLNEKCVDKFKNAEEASVLENPLNIVIKKEPNSESFSVEETITAIQSNLVVKVEETSTDNKVSDSDNFNNNTFVSDTNSITKSPEELPGNIVIESELNIDHDRAESEVSAELKTVQNDENLDMVDVKSEVQENNLFNESSPKNADHINNKQDIVVVSSPPSDIIMVENEEKKQEIMNIEAIETEKEKENTPPHKSQNNTNGPRLTDFSLISDDEDDKDGILTVVSSADSTTKDKQQETEKDVVNLDDDDEIMVIDDVIPHTQEISTVQKSDEKTTENKDIEILEPVTWKEKVCSPTPPINNMESDEKISMEAVIPRKPLLPTNFLSTFKTKLKDMTREELEEFCLLKMVEGVVERSGLADLTSKLKLLEKQAEHWKKKSIFLGKQLRDLSLVVKTVEEEQRQRVNQIVQPLRITRSVGLQVLMTDTKSNQRAKVMTYSNKNINQTQTGNALRKPPATNSLIGTTIKNQNVNIPVSGKQIPVPKLVPANLNSPAKVQKNQSILEKTLEKPIKRPYNSIQSIDLTDDEPASKQQAVTPSRTPQRQQVNSSKPILIPYNQVRQTGTGAVLYKQPQQQGPRVMRLPTPASLSMTRANAGQIQVRSNLKPVLKHPAPLPTPQKQPHLPSWKALPPPPVLKIAKVDNGIVISWVMDGYLDDKFEEIASYQLYAYQETNSVPSTLLWKKIGDVKALPLPMACTLTQFMAGYKYYFAVRAVDVKCRVGPFSFPGSILLLNNK